MPRKGMGSKQPVAVAPGGGYGDRQAAVAAQQAVPLPQAAPMGAPAPAGAPAMSPAPPQPVDMAAAVAAAQNFDPGGLALDGPTAFPNESMMAGVGQPNQRSNGNARILRQLAADTGNSYWDQLALQAERLA